MYYHPSFGRVHVIVFYHVKFMHIYKGGGNNRKAYIYPTVHINVN